jgi:hypothetical protein
VLREQPAGRERERRHQNRAQGPPQRLHGGSIPVLPDGGFPYLGGTAPPDEAHGLITTGVPSGSSCASIVIDPFEMRTQP